MSLFTEAHVHMFTRRAFPVLQKAFTQHGKILGGGSSINYMLYVRGHKEDYNNWERHGCAGWGWDTVERYFKKMEDYFIDNGMINLYHCF